MAPLNLKPHEETFDLRPIGIKYRCEFCNEGEMKYGTGNDQPAIALAVHPPLYQHTCTKCGKTMHLPKMYPYIEWMPCD